MIQSLFPSFSGLLGNQESSIYYMEIFLLYPVFHNGERLIQWHYG